MPPRFTPPLGVLAELELQFAKARFAEDYFCVPVIVSGALRVN